MKWTEIPSGVLHVANDRLWDALGGEADAVAARINQDPKYLANLARFAIGSGYESTPSQKRAREIMRANFFGVEEAIKFFMIHPSRSDLAFLAEVPFSETVLESCKETHILVAVFPLSIRELREQVEGRVQFYEPGWYENLAFANRKGEIGWELLSKTSLPGSTSKDWDEEQSLLAGSDEETPAAQVVVYTILGHFLNTGERLFDHLYVHCKDISSLHYRVGVAFFAAAININSWPEDRRNESIGLATARRKRLTR